MTLPSGRCGAVVLAAGASSRLGGFKPLADLGGQTLLARAAALFRPLGVADILVVAGRLTGDWPGKVRAEAARLGLACAENPDPAGDMFSSVRAGLGALSALPGPGLDAVFVLPVDMPLVRPHTLRLVLERFSGSPGAVLHPVFGGQRGHPPLIPSRHVPAILAWEGGGGLAGALDALPGEDVPVADRNIHFDVDTPADMDEARRRAARWDIPAPGEALALLDLHHAGERGLAHGRGVADAALALARALNARGAALDLELTESAALLHDIAKGQPGHELAGADLLEGLGYGPAARIVVAHRDIAPGDVPAITERELVYLADKLVRGPERVGIPRRFQEKLDRFAHDAEATAAIRRRLGHALAMRQMVERQAGRSLEEILGVGGGER